MACGRTTRLSVIHAHLHAYVAVRIVQRKLGWKEVGDDEDWEIYWTDTSVGIERIIKLNKFQVRLSLRVRQQLSLRWRRG